MRLRIRALSRQGAWTWLLGRHAHQLPGASHPIAENFSRKTRLFTGTCIVIGLLTSSYPLAAIADEASEETVRNTRRRSVPLSVMTWNTYEKDENNKEIADIVYRAVGDERGIVGVTGFQEMCFDELDDVERIVEGRSGKEWSSEDSRPYGDYREDWLGPFDPTCDNGNAILAARPETLLGPVDRNSFSAQDSKECEDSGKPKENGECRSYVRLDVKVGGVWVRTYSTHLTHKSDTVRAAQIRELTNDIRAERFQGPRVVMGDFNASPRSSVLDPMYHLFTDVLGRGDNTPTDDAGPCPSRGKRIDFIFVSKPIQVRQAYVPRLSDDDNPSDHCPVVAKLRIRVLARANSDV
ncbi:MAG: endonuclease/exonuclease/phosphatase family protein [Actinomycetota bacterium]